MTFALTHYSGKWWRFWWCRHDYRLDSYDVYDSSFDAVCQKCGREINAYGHQLPVGIRNKPWTDGVVRS